LLAEPAAIGKEVHLPAFDPSLKDTILRSYRQIVETKCSETQLIRFLENDLAISASSIAMAIRQSEQNPGPLHMILWQYGLVSLEQLEQIFDWLEK
jgi:hypothetical protein